MFECDCRPKISVKSLTLNDFCYKIKLLPWTAVQSFKSSPSGNLTAALKLIPEFKLAHACLCRLYLIVP